MRLTSTTVVRASAVTEQYRRLVTAVLKTLKTVMIELVATVEWF